MLSRRHPPALYVLIGAFLLMHAGCTKEPPPKAAVAPAEHIISPVGTTQTILQKTFNLRASATFPFEIPAHAVEPHLHGIFESFVANDPRSAECLLLLMRDEDEEVRDWATFGLGVQGDLDSVEIRNALFERLSDSNEDVRNEAMASLGKRRDQRVLPPLVTTLAESAVSRPVIEGACGMLDMDAERQDWTTSDYASALRERYGHDMIK